MQLHLIRHPRPAVEPGICYGQTDLGLAESPAAVAERLRPLLPESFALHASPLARARLLAESLGRPRLDERLKEIHFGDWEGRSFTDIGSAIDDWAADPLGFRPPGGESPREMATRVLQWLAEHGLTPRTPDAAGIRASPPLPDALVVVAHGGPLRAIAGHLLGMPPERWIGLDFGCGQVTRIDVEDWGTVLRWFNR
ncbi:MULTISPECIES: alpha-ribazole phosphatase family protein [Thauera]|jgi:alpha-ribazole phosphatase|uniref:Phosphoglycerate mutase n=1 Tax=Thauera aminoaromatica TaxID=164330 RepID=C4KCG4_THASP|nr:MULTISPECIES: alpha-ribazole phosphatase family protein [Thauera]ACR02355.1 Phosphoglycerate mutase [Thauera aminoaromatica]MBP6131332.1 alpha-ribazole phosphatase family protein [Thauera sp.]MBP7047328.1 alpha-ribazole phosphatase family protein [Thauera sp.]